MIILDTNVVSELMRPRPNAAVADWVNRQPRRTLLTTSITQAEVLYGIALLPSGRRKASLDAEARRMFREDFADILPFTTAAAPHFAELVSARRRAGRPIGILDAQIAAIALADADAEIATRDVGDFVGCGVGIIDPWQA